MFRTWRITLFTLLLAVATLPLFAQRGPQPGDPLLLLAPNTVSSVPLLALVDRYPGDYRLEFFTDHPQALARLLQGEADLLATGFAVGFTRHRAAGDLLHLATPVWGVSAVMTSTPVTSLADLAGEEIYAPFEGSPIEVFLQAILAEEGLTGRVRIAYAPFPQAAALVAQGNAAAAVLVEPIASRLELAGTAHRLENLHDGWARVTGGEARSPQVSLFTRRTTASRRPDAEQVLASRLAAIVREINGSPDAFGRQYAGALGVPVPVAQRAVANTLFDLPSAVETQELIAGYARVMGLSPPDQRMYRRGE